MMKELLQVSNTKLLVILGLSVLWIVAGWTLYALVGADHGPDGGLDSIADAIVYVFVWKLGIYAPPFLISVVSFFLWLYQHHRKAIIWVAALVIVSISFTFIYDKYLKKYVNTPERVAGHIDTYEKWAEKEKRYPVNEKYTESDYICEYIHEIIYEAVSDYHSLYHEDNIEKRIEYVNAALEAHYKELPQVERWEYIPDVRMLIPPRSDGDDEFLLNHSELCAVAEHYSKELRTDHWYDRYQFNSSAIAEWYSWLPMCAVIYDDGTMDIVIATG